MHCYRDIMELRQWRDTMGLKTGFTACGILLICLCTMHLIPTDTGSVAYAGDSILLVNTTNRALSCSGIFKTRTREPGYTYYVDPSSSSNIPTRIDEGWQYGPLIRLWCMEKSALTDQHATRIDFTYGGPYPARCRVVRTDGYDGCAIEKMEIQCP